MAINLQGEGILAAHIVRATDARPAVTRVSFRPTAEGTVAEALDKLAKELVLARYQCTTLLAQNEYQLLSVDAPNVPPEELKSAIRWRIKDMLDYHIDDATVDVLEIPMDKAGGSRSQGMYVVAARNQVIRTRQELFSDARIPLKAIDIPEMAQRNFSALLEQEGRGLAFLSFSQDGGLLTVSYNGELYLTRRIDLGLGQLQHQDADQRNAHYDRVTLELQRSLDHFERQYHFITISRLVLGPLGDIQESLRSYLSSNLYLPVETFDLSSIIDVQQAPELANPDNQLRYFMTVGAALRHEETVL